MNADTDDNKAKIRRSAWTLVLVALAFYFGFILLGVLRS
jgi:uncharacterized membrane protein (DUF485 family)